MEEALQIALAEWRMRMKIERWKSHDECAACGASWKLCYCYSEEAVQLELQEAAAPYISYLDRLLP